MVRFADDAVLGFEREDDARKWLSRRSRAAQLNWTQFNRLLQRYPLQPARVVHGVYAT